MLFNFTHPIDGMFTSCYIDIQICYVTAVCAVVQELAINFTTD